jgi:hypothetical protein
MSSAFLILFYIALACLAVVLGRQLLIPRQYKPASATIFNISVIASGVRHFIIWIPSILRMTLVNIAGGIVLAIRAVGKRLDSYRHRHEKTEG